MAILRKKKVTVEALQDYIELISKMFHQHSFDKAKLFRELEAQHIVEVIGDVRVVENNENHEKWFNPSTNARN